MVKTLAEMCVKAFKNPCDGSQAKKLGRMSPYCYLLQFANMISIAINKNVFAM